MRSWVSERDVGERCIMMCAKRVRTVVTCCICAMNVPGEGPNEKLLHGVSSKSSSCILVFSSGQLAA